VTEPPPSANDPPARAALSLSRGELHARVWAQPLAAVAAELGVSRSGLAKICDRLLIPVPGRGYWSAGARRPAPAPLPPDPAGCEAPVVLSAGRSASRRARTRLSPEARREQLLDAAGAIIAREGVHAASLKRVAREVGLSEAQAHNHFSRRTDLLAALARRELDAMNAVREAEIERGADSLARVTLSTITYLRQVAERGALIQELLNLPQVRAGLRPEREARASLGLRRMTERLNARYGVADDLGHAATAILTAVCLRAGRLLAEGKIPLDMAERLTLAIVTAGNRSLTRAARDGAATLTGP
jgi:AcrR family transcriptional regulator